MDQSEEQGGGRRSNGAVPVSQFAKTPPKKMATDAARRVGPTSDKPAAR